MERYKLLRNTENLQVPMADSSIWKQLSQQTKHSDIYLQMNIAQLATLMVPLLKVPDTLKGKPSEFSLEGKQHICYAFKMAFISSLRILKNTTTKKLLKRNCCQNSDRYMYVTQKQNEETQYIYWALQGLLKIFKKICAETNCCSYSCFIPVQKLWQSNLQKSILKKLLIYVRQLKKENEVSNKRFCELIGKLVAGEEYAQ